MAVTLKSPVGDISVVTLIRTDTTLDHSQKAEKVCICLEIHPARDKKRNLQCSQNRETSRTRNSPIHKISRNDVLYKLSNFAAAHCDTSNTRQFRLEACRVILVDVGETLVGLSQVLSAMLRVSHEGLQDER